MKRLLAVLGFVLICGTAHAWVINHELRPQFRLWKSSSLETGDYAGTQIATAPIIFHCLIGSGTVNFGGSSAFTLFQDTGMINMTPVTSTKAYIALDSLSGGSALGDQLDILVTTHSFFNKVGPSRVQYLWDYLDGGAQLNKYPRD